MAYDRYQVVKVKGCSPEVFWIIWVDSALPKDSFMKTSQGLSEVALRDELKTTMKLSDVHISSLIQQARENPR